ncbi:hypothetical protein BBJ28_00020301 [Nothophytophthora sp. Chile5]|nr:hypothetical protein BBJ28_00020301 [Nothophytophthora sp. Chile5]
MAASPHARDGDGKALMSLEQLKEGMFQSIRDAGTVELIRAQLRRRFIEKLRHQRDNQDGSDTIQSRLDAESSSPEQKLLHGLVAEFLASQGLENTLAVFIPEIGGSRNQVDSATVLEVGLLTQSGRSLLLVLIRELMRRFRLVTMESGTQTAMDCFDHRIVLENQLRRVENTYLAECAAQKLEPQTSLEERMVQYQLEYDAICEQRLREELERYKTTEVALVRAEERKRFDREVDSLRASLHQEYRDKQSRLQESERELELAFVAKRTQLETSLFETRQSLFKDMERLRVKEAELQVKVESDFRHFATETQRFQLWEESVRTQEANLESIVAQATRDKQRGWQLERQKALQDIQTRQDELSNRETTLAGEFGTLKALKTQTTTLQQEVAGLEVALSTAHTAIARLSTEKTLLEAELARTRQHSEASEGQLKLLSHEIKTQQQQVLELKLDEANAVVSERKKFLQLLEEERERFQWKENELVAKLRDVQSRLAESEAATEKFQSQFEDEKLHVESLRHDVSSLNSLLTQAQATINAKHAAPRDFSSSRPQRSVTTSSNADLTAFSAPDRGGERTFMMKMMEMMANLPDGSRMERMESSEAGFGAPGTLNQQVPAVQEAVLPALPRDEGAEEAQNLKKEQERLERELLEQREFEKKKQARLEAQERELAEQQTQFEDKMRRLRQERLDEEERLEARRKRQVAEEETQLQEQLERQCTALREAAELQQKLAEQRLAEEQQRALDQQAYEERRRVEEAKCEEEREARRQRQLELEEEERQKAEEARQRTQLEAQEAGRRAERQKQEEEENEQREMAVRLEEEARKQRQVAAEGRQEIQEAAAKEQEVEKSLEGEEDIASNSDPPMVEEGLGDSQDASLPEKATLAPVAEGAPSTEIPRSDEGESSEAESAPDSVEVGEIGVETAEEAAEPNALAEVAGKSPEQEAEERRQAEEEAKRKQDEDVIDVYRQRVLARKAAEKQREELEAAETERKQREEAAQAPPDELERASDSDHELELSGGSFAESSSEFDLSRSTSERGHDRTVATSTRSTRLPPRGGLFGSTGLDDRGDSTPRTSRRAFEEGAGGIHDNQREAAPYTREELGHDLKGSLAWDRQRSTWGSEMESLSAPSKRSNALSMDDYGVDFSSYDTSTVRSTVEHLSSSPTSTYESHVKSEALRDATSATMLTDRAAFDDDDTSRIAPSTYSSVTNGEEPSSPTNSDASLPASSPRLHMEPDTSRSTLRCLEVASQRSAASEDSDNPRISSLSYQSARLTTTSSSERREELYAFRKQMREVFIRVEDMVDLHRAFFRSDPSTGAPVVNVKLEKEATQLAEETFDQLAALRSRFSRLARDFHQPHEAPKTAIDRKQAMTGHKSVAATDFSKRVPATTTNQESDDESEDAERSDEEQREVARSRRPAFGSGYSRDRVSELPTRGASNQVGNCESPPSSVKSEISSRSTASTFFTPELKSRGYGASVASESVESSPLGAREPEVGHLFHGEGF